MLKVNCLTERISAETESREMNQSSIDRKKRLLFSSLPLLVTCPSLLAQSTTNPIALRKLHSFGIQVTDVDASVKFYQEVFGAPVQARQGDTVCLRIGSGPRFFSISPLRPGQQPGITHIGLGIEGFLIDSVKAQLETFGVTAGSMPDANSAALDHAMTYWERTRYSDRGGERSGTRELFFQDVEGISYQLSGLDHCGGGGVSGNVCSALEAAPGPGLFQLTDLSHFTTFLANKDRANSFYMTAFDKQFQAYQGAFPLIGVGDGLQFLMYVGGAQEGVPTRPGRIDHVSLNMTDFSVDAILQKLDRIGFSARQDANNTQPLMHWVSMRMPERGGAEGGTPEVYFSDPDGIHIQLQDASYCGGGGYLGDSCPAL